MDCVIARHEKEKLFPAFQKFESKEFSGFPCKISLKKKIGGEGTLQQTEAFTRFQVASPKKQSWYSCNKCKYLTPKHSHITRHVHSIHTNMRTSLATKYKYSACDVLVTNLYVVGGFQTFNCKWNQKLLEELD
eukprot:761408-Hanusia_phi.AAC.8